ncbi:MAG TPA: maleylpyruvate isomerase family mycothiol-dependent enzyme [Acidimicrobiales bacterium]|jgi:uncharacterized protein (TIGR03083 family)|nr:maleylpyruvate isomerase family mycothiol-dependent enzyme [Acidimicrobiales bacterium]
MDRDQAILTESSRIADLIAGTDLAAPVPSCPDWSFRDLVLHIGEVQRFWAGDLRAGDPTQPWRGVTAQPESDDDLESWMRASTADLLGALSEVGDEARCWTWWGEPLTSGAIGRHQVQEAAVHRWDAELASGSAAPLSHEIAHDGVGEFLAVKFGATDPADRPGPITLRSTDTDGEWQVGDSAGGAASIVVTGTASNLVLALYGRFDVSDLAIEGDAAATAAFFGTIDNE